MNKSPENNAPLYSRRTFLKGTLIGAGTLATSGLLACSSQEPAPLVPSGGMPPLDTTPGAKASTTTEVNKTPTTEATRDKTFTSFETPNNTYIGLGERVDLSLEKFAISSTPDGHITYTTFDDNSRLTLITGENSTYGFRSQGSKNLFTGEKNEVIQPYNVIGPDATKPYRNGYCGISSLIQIDDRNPKHIFALTHNEAHVSKGDGKNFTATVGLLESYDQGKNWNDLGVVISGQDALAPGKKVSGAGQPSAIVRYEGGKPYIHVYHVDWSAQEKIFPPDQIYLARLPFDNGKVGTAEFLTTNGFKTEIKAGEKFPVITPPQNILDSSYAAIPSISFNKKLNMLLCVFETNVGFAITKSKDGVLWETPELIARFPQPNSRVKKGDSWYSYPTLVSTEQATDQITSNTGTLFCARRKWGESEGHQLSYLPFELK